MFTNNCQQFFNGGVNMMAFIKNYSLENIKNKLLILYILNVTDIIFTLLLLSNGLYMEVNTLMAKAVQSPTASLALKVILPAILFIFIYFRMHKASAKQLKQSNLIINFATAVYVVINVSHIIWISLIPVFMILF